MTRFVTEMMKQTQISMQQSSLQTRRPPSRLLLSLLVAALALPLPQPALAVGLGAATVESAVNEPLLVRIDLLELQGTPPQDVIVALASAEEFRHFGVERAAFLDNIRFNTVATANGGYVELTTAADTPVPMAFMVLVLDVRWPAGRLLSEQNISLGLPLFNENEPPATVAATASPPVPVTAAEIGSTGRGDLAGAAASGSIVSRTVEPADIASDSAIAADSAGAGPRSIEVGSSDSLANIAARVRPSPSVTLQQTMLALQRMNPEAFEGGNINRLRSGQILRIPELARIQQVDPRDAERFINEQNQAFADFQVLTTSNVSATSPPPPLEDFGGQLSVVTVPDLDADSAVADGMSSDELDRRIAALEAILAQHQEESDRARLQQQELSARLTDLDLQIAEAEEIIRLRDIELAQLRQALTDAAAQERARRATEVFGDMLDSLLTDKYYWLGGALAVMLLTLMLRGSGRVSGRYIMAGGIRSDHFDIDPDRVPGSRSGRNVRDSRGARNKTAKVGGVETSGGHWHRTATGTSERQGRPPEQLSIGKRIIRGQVAKKAKQSDRGEQGTLDSSDEWVSTARSASRGQASAGEWVSAARPATRKSIHEKTEQPPVRSAAAVSAGDGKTTSGTSLGASSTTGTDVGGGVGVSSTVTSAAKDNVGKPPVQQMEALFDPSQLEAKIPSGEGISDLSADDETAIKLELAYAYQKMGDTKGAADILKEVIQEGNRVQVKEAQQMLDSM